MRAEVVPDESDQGENEPDELPRSLDEGLGEIE
jgi:hypothetical protein